ncbi:Ig-like domain repeat protein, partial [Methanobrevibacter sp.]|uniref:Ig-like domain repeat protein n=1 Tax=Methanobrevibacter sp. TaxID=66852 RepID=UPI00388D6E07
MGTASAMEDNANNETQVLSAVNNDEIVAIDNTQEILSAGQPATFADLAAEIGDGGDKNLGGKIYTYDGSSAAGNSFITITQPGTIDGQGAVIDMDGAYFRLFKVNTDNVIFKNITFKNANFMEEGPVILFYLGGTLEDCTFVDNTAGSGAAGAVYFTGEGSVTNCNFTRNTASGNNAGAVYFNGIGTVTDSNFINNTAGGSLPVNGGAVYFAGAGSVTGSNFIGNNVTNGDGGAVYFYGDGTVTDCNFTNNSVSGYAGAVYFKYTGKLENSNFINNSAEMGNGAVYFSDPGSVNYCNFINNTAKTGGAGAVYFKRAGNVTNSKFINNSAINKATTGITGGGAIQFNASANVTNCIFIGNRALNGNGGGAIYILNSANVNVKNSKFEKNYMSEITGSGSNAGGGAIFFESTTTGSIDYCNFTDNYGLSGTGGGAINAKSSINVTNSNFKNNTFFDTTHGGGALYFVGGSNVVNCNFTDNSASSNGGAIYDIYSQDKPDNLIVTNSNFVNNRANETENGGGGAIYSSTYCIVDDCNFTYNSASKDGGAIYVGKGEVSNSIFVNNEALSGTDGAVRIGTGTVNNSNFTDNVANYAGAVGITSGNITNCNFNNDHAGTTGAVTLSSGTVDNCNFTGNYAYNANSGAISGSGCNVYNSNFNNVYASGAGGAIGTSFGDVVNCSFTNIHGSSGGAIHQESGNVINCSFTDIYATGDGGAIQFTNAGLFSSVNNCNFENISSKNGRGGSVFGAGNGEVKNSNFTNSSSSGFGGTVYFAKETTVDNCNFVDSVTKGINMYGGTIYMGSGDVKNSNFTNSSTYNLGGAVYFKEEGSVENSSFTNCSVIRDNGGAVYFGATGSVKNSNFNNNSAGNLASAVFFKNTGSVDYSNFTNNKVLGSIGGGAVYFDEEGSVNYSNFNNNSASSSGGAVYFDAEGSVNYSNFTDNKASTFGGAVYFNTVGSVDKSNFKDNYARSGSAIYFNSAASPQAKSVKNSNLLNNKARSTGLIINHDIRNIVKITFTGGDNFLNAIYSNSGIDFDNVTYWGVNGVNNTDTSSVFRSINEYGQNLTVTINHDGAVEQKNLVTDINGDVSLEITAAGHYLISATHPDDSYYTSITQTIEFALLNTTTDLEIEGTTAKAYVNPLDTPPYPSGYVTFTVTNESGVVKEGDAPVKSKEWGHGVLFEFDLSGLSLGKYNITAYYNGDTNYLPSSDNTSFELKQLNSTITIDKIYNIRVGEDEEIWYTINDDWFADNPVYVNGVKYDGEDGELVLENLPEGIYLVEIYYEGDDIYLPGYNSSTFAVVEDIPYYVTVQDKTGILNQPVNITAVSNLKHDLLNGTMTFDIYNGNVYIDTVEATLSDDGIWWAEYTFDDSLFSVTSNAIIKSVYDALDDVTYNDGHITLRHAIPFTIDAEDVDYGNKVNITIDLPSDVAGNITFYIGDKNYTTENFQVNPKYFIIPDIFAAGPYTVNAVYSGDGYYHANTTSTTFNVNRAAPTITINASDIVVGSNAIINATLPENATGKITLIVNHQEYEVNSGESISVPDLNVGNYEVIALYDGDQNYTNAHAFKSFNVIKKNLTVSLDEVTDKIQVGSPVTLTAKLNETVTGDVVFTVNGVNHTVAVSDADYITYDYTPVDNSPLTVVATFISNDKFNGNKSTPMTLTVNGIPTNVTVTFDSPIFVGSDAVITVKLNASIDTTVKLTINGENHDVAILGGTGEYIASNLANDTYTITATFAGNDRYAGNSSEPQTLEVNKIPTNLTIKLDDDVISVGDNAVIRVVLNQTIDTTVTVKVNNHNYTVGIVNGKGNLTLYDLENDIYIINATYAGDSKYLGNTSNTLTLTVDKIPTSIQVSANEPKVGENAVITINMQPSVNAIVRLKVGEETYYVAVVNGVGTFNVSDLAYGTYDVNVTFDGDSKFLYSTNNTTLTVSKIADYPLNVTTENIVFGDDETITVTLPADINKDNLVVKVDGDVKVPVSVVNGVATVVVPGLTVGQHEVNVTYLGDDKYEVKNNNSNMFTVSPSPNCNIVLDVDNKTYGEDTTFTVTLPSSVTENVTITVDGKDYSRKPDAQGVATLTLNNLTGGLHTVTATYPGDGIYSANSTSDTFVIPRAASTIDVDFTTPKSVGDDVLINVTMGQEINGTVILSVGDNNYAVAVTNGNGSYVVSGLTNNVYNIKAEFKGDENYTASASDVKQLAIDKVPTSIVVAVNATINVGQVAVVNITIDKKLNGSAVVSVNGENHTVAIIDGNGTLTLANLAADTYTINATFKGDNQYVGSTSNTATLTVNKVDTKAVIDDIVTDLTNNVTSVTVNITDKDGNLVYVSGNVTITVEDESGFVKNVTSDEFVGSSVTVDLGVLAPGHYNITAVYNGNDNYANSTNDTSDYRVPLATNYD